MKKFPLYLFFLVCTVHGLAQSTMDPALSTVRWTATKLTGEHTGLVPVLRGRLTAENGKLTQAEVTMDMKGITCTDIENEGANAKLVGHLKGEDFFNVADHGTAVFTSTRIEAIPAVAAGKPNFKVYGDLTIKGITKATSFDLLYWMDGEKHRAAGTFTFDRAQYDIRYRSSSFFPDLGDRVIADNVSLTFDVTAQ